MQQPRLSHRLTGPLKFAALIALPLAVATYVGGAQADGGIDSEAQAGRQMVGVLRGDHTRASYRRCRDERTRFEYPDVRRIPAENVRRIIRFYENDIARIRAGSRPRAVCWRSHLWAQSQPVRCIVELESGGNLRARSRPAGTYAGLYQSDQAFEQAYGREFVRLGRADRWPEHAQDLMAWRGYLARGFQPWPNTSRACGLR